jgi:cell wall-associated NlpC family hydrolase
MEVNWKNVHPALLELAIKKACVGFMPTPYLLGGQEPGVGLDCSGMVIESFKEVGLEITDRTALQLYTDIFLHDTPPKRGPVVEAFFGDGTLSDHIAIRLDGQHVIHSTDQEDWVAANNGVDGVMVTKYDHFIEVYKGIESTLNRIWLDLGWLLYFHEVES